MNHQGEKLADRGWSDEERDLPCQSPSRSWAIRMLKTRTGLLGRVLIDRARRVRDYARTRLCTRPGRSHAFRVSSKGVRAARVQGRQGWGGPRAVGSWLPGFSFIVRPGPFDAACTRYRGYNIMEGFDWLESRPTTLTTDESPNDSKRSSFLISSSWCGDGYLRRSPGCWNLRTSSRSPSSATLMTTSSMKRLSRAAITFTRCR